MTTDPRPAGHGDRCDGPKRQGTGTCTQRAGWGTPHPGVGRCKLHLGSTPSHVAAGQRALAERAVQTYGAPREVTPIQAMVELLHDSAGHVAWLRGIVQATDPDALIWGKADEVNRVGGEFPGVDTKYSAAPSVWLVQYDKERRFLLDVSRDLARLGIAWDAREAIRKQGAALASVVRDVVRRLGRDPNDPAVAGAFRAALKEAVGLGAGLDGVVEGRLA
jgi:hypothetical protein